MPSASGRQPADPCNKVLDDAILRGSGAGMPQGLLVSPATITVAAESGQTADTIVAMNFLNMAARLAPGSWNGARWFVHPSAVPFLARSTPAATAASGAAAEYASALPVVSFDGGSGEWRILGRPVTLTDRCSALGDLGDVVLADLTQYALGLSPVLFLDRSNAPGWLAAQIHLCAISRSDGQPLWEAPQTPRHGSDTCSPFVVLAAR